MFDHKKDNLTEAMGISDPDAVVIGKLVDSTMERFPALSEAVEFLVRNLPQNQAMFALIVLGGRRREMALEIAALKTLSAVMEETMKQEAETPVPEEIRRSAH